MIEVNPSDLSLQKPLGYVFYSLKKFSKQTLNSRYIWRDMGVNLSYTMVNEKVLRKKIFEFKSINNINNNNDNKQLEKSIVTKSKPPGIFFEAEFIYEVAAKLLKIKIFNIITKTLNQISKTYRSFNV